MEIPNLLSTRPRRLALLLLTAFSAILVGIMVQPEVEAGPPPPRPEWVDPDGRVSLSELPDVVQVLDANGKVTGTRKNIKPHPPSLSSPVVDSSGKNRRIEIVNGVPVETVETVESARKRQ